MPRETKPRLGRGLASLIRPSTDAAPDGRYVPTDGHAPPLGPAAALASTGPLLVPTSDIGPNPHQPRRTFDEHGLAELAASLRTHGLLQPVLVADAPPGAEGPRYHLIAGERRLRAASLAGLAKIPCIVRPASDQDMLEIALIENIHRTDLNPIERAGAYRDLIDRFDLTQQQLADRLGQPRASIANTIRMLDLCDAVQAIIIDGALSFGHAKVLAGLAGSPDRQAALARKAVSASLSVRQLERLVQAVQAAGAAVAPQGPPVDARPPYLGDLEGQLAQALGARVSIRPGRAKHTGRIVIHYRGLDDFDRIVQALGVQIDS